jgi:hypothetical protein
VKLEATATSVVADQLAELISSSAKVMNGREKLVNNMGYLQKLG